MFMDKYHMNIFLSTQFNSNTKVYGGKYNGKSCSSQIFAFLRH